MNEIRQAATYNDGDGYIVKGFYVGAQGRLPPVHSFVQVTNQKTGEVWTGKVILVSATRKTYDLQRVMGVDG